MAKVEIDFKAPAKACVCVICKEEFTSKTKLFKHLEIHGYEGPNTKPERVVVLVGWLAEYCKDCDEWTTDMANTSAGKEFILDKVESAVYGALYALENNIESVAEIPTSIQIERPKGSSRASSVVQRSAVLLGVEASCHGLCDTFCLNAKRYAGGDQEWTEKMNALLPTSVRLLQRYTLSAEMLPNEFHAEVSCTQYRYEYMLPLRLLMPPSSVAPVQQMEGPAVSGDIGTWLQQSIVRRKVYHPSEKNMPSTGVYSMDQQFPFETAEGQARVAFFRNLKRISKDIAGRKAFHNFASGGASPEDNVSMRKIDRIYHKELVNIQDEPWVVFSVSGDAFLKGQVRRILGVMVGIARGLLPENYFEMCTGKTSIAEVPALPGWGLYLAECKYAYYEAKFEDFRLDPRRIPGADHSAVDSWKTAIHTHIAAISNQVGDAWLAEFESNCRTMRQHVEAMQVLMTRPRSLLEEMYTNQFHRPAPVLVAPAPVAEGESAPVPVVSAPQATSEAVSLHPDPVVSAAYACVLRLLQEADLSGLWPANSTGRQKVILNAPVGEAAEGEADAPADESKESATGDWVKVEKTADANTEEVIPSTTSTSASTKAPRKMRAKNMKNDKPKVKKQRSEQPASSPVRSEADPTETADRSSTPSSQENGEESVAGASRQGVKRPPLQPAHRRAVESTVELVSDAGVGGSFSVGCLPKHLAQPKGNNLFPELLRACFDLERVLCPDRPPSSTIAINRHAQFSPHRDSGAGSGQSQSLIVALGDFTGGEIAVENTAHDIRYKPLEFNGWMERHWTLPFVGQRFSLVWFTPLGITEDDLWWWKN